MLFGLHGLLTGSGLTDREESSGAAQAALASDSMGQEEGFTWGPQVEAFRAAAMARALPVAPPTSGRAVESGGVLGFAAGDQTRAADSASRGALFAGYGRAELAAVLRVHEATAAGAPQGDAVDAVAEDEALPFGLHDAIRRAVEGDLGI